MKNANDNDVNFLKLTVVTFKYTVDPGSIYDTPCAQEIMSDQSHEWTLNTVDVSIKPKRNKT